MNLYQRGFGIGNILNSFRVYSLISWQGVLKGDKKILKNGEPFLKNSVSKTR